jgi:hypothetical protein
MCCVHRYLQKMSGIYFPQRAAFAAIAAPWRALRETLI